MFSRRSTAVSRSAVPLLLVVRTFRWSTQTTRPRGRHVNVRSPVVPRRQRHRRRRSHHRREQPLRDLHPCRWCCATRGERPWPRGPGRLRAPVPRRRPERPGDPRLARGLHLRDVLQDRGPHERRHPRPASTRRNGGVPGPTRANAPDPQPRGAHGTGHRPRLGPRPDRTALRPGRRRWDDIASVRPPSGRARARLGQLQRHDRQLCRRRDAPRKRVDHVRGNCQRPAAGVRAEAWLQLRRPRERRRPRRRSTPHRHGAIRARSHRDRPRHRVRVRDRGLGQRQRLLPLPACQPP